MPENTDLPPVLEILGEDLYVAMKAADAARPIGSRRHKLGWLATIVSQRGRLIGKIARTPRVPKRWATVGVAAVAIAAAVLVLGTTGGGPANAFAGWTASPTTPARGQLRAAESACGKSARSVTSLTPTVADTRGPFSMLVYLGSGAARVCVTGLPGGSTFVRAVGAVASTVDPGAIEPEAGVAHREVLRQSAGSATGTSPRGGLDFGILTGQSARTLPA